MSKRRGIALAASASKNRKITDLFKRSNRPPSTPPASTATSEGPANSDPRDVDILQLDIPSVEPSSAVHNLPQMAESNTTSVQAPVAESSSTSVDVTESSITYVEDNVPDTESCVPAPSTVASSCETTSDELSPHIDVGEVVKRHTIKNLSAHEKLNYLENHYKPDESYKFHTTSHFVKSKNKTVTLGFQRSWLREFTWLVYSPLLEGGLCKYCVLFPPDDKPRVAPGQLVTDVFQNYRKAKGKEGILDKHANLQYHKDAMTKGAELKLVSKTPKATVQYMLSKKQKETYDQNYHILESVIETILLCGRQNIPLRGHRDDNTASSSANRGTCNFIALLENTAKHDTVLRDHLEYGRKNAKYTSKTVQNAIIELIATQIRQKLTSSLAGGAFFATIADELTDAHTNEEVLTVCLRFLQEIDGRFSVREVFLDFVMLERATGEQIAASIVASLRKHCIDILKCRGQSYDGAACMSSEAAGTQGHIKRLAPKALYTHCKSHALNLTISASCKLPLIRNMIDQINETFLFFDNSGKRQRFFERVLQKKNCTSSKEKLVGLCKTRWVERHTCYDTLLEMYEFVCLCLDAVLNATDEQYQDLYDEDWKGTPWDRETRVKAQGLLATLTSFNFIIAFLIAKNTLEVVKGIAAKLQKSDLDAYKAYSLIDSCLERFERFRRNVDAEFQETYQVAVSLCEKVGGTVSMPRLAKRQVHRENIPADNPQTYYRKNAQIPFLDHLITEMKKRFDKENRICGEIFCLVPAAVVKLSDDELVRTCESLSFWKDDLPTPTSLPAEIKEWKHLWSQKDVKPQDMISTLNETDVDMFPNVHVLLRIGCTLPVGSSGAERSFSCLRRTKTYLRNRMGAERLSGLCLMNIHRDVEVDIPLIIKQYATNFRTRMLLGPILFDRE